MNFFSLFNYEFILLWIFLIPVTGALVVYFVGLKNEGIRNILAVVISGITCLLCGGVFLSALQSPVIWEFKFFLDFGLFLRADIWGSFMALLASFMWFLATVFSLTYMSHEHNRNRYYSFLLLTLGACMGVFLSGDLFSLFVFFEMMSLTSYVLVIHAQTDVAMAAGRNYLFLSVFGGLMILTGTILLFQQTGTTALTPLLTSMGTSDTLSFVIAGFLIIGFGIKAGMVPLHIWLPKAHPVAPAPASALLSGIMIKTGAYGIIRVINLIMTPSGGEEKHLWATAQTLGLTIIWLAIVTMFAGALMALFQTNIKRVLAYSSISQMGYILMGVGCAAYLGFEGPMGFGGFSYHILNHAFFKTGMFMMVGAIYVRTHELEFSRLGGLAKYFPVTMIAFLIAAAGISGVPGFNGYISKTLLHHGIEYVYEYSGSIYLLMAEKLFTITGALTVCYITRLFISIFFGKKPSNLHDIKPEPLSERIVFLVIAASVILLGLFPQTVLSKLIVPATGGFVFEPTKVNYLLQQNFINVNDLMGVIIPITAGILLFLFMKKKNVFSNKLPGWLSVEKLLYTPVTGIALNIYTFIGNSLEKTIEKSYIASPYSLVALCSPASYMEKVIDNTYVKGPISLAAICQRVSYFDSFYTSTIGNALYKIIVRIRDFIYQKWIDLILFISTAFKTLLIRSFRTLSQVDKKPKEGKASLLSLANLDFNLIIVVITLIIVLGVTFIVS